MPTTRDPLMDEFLKEQWYAAYYELQVTFTDTNWRELKRLKQMFYKYRIKIKLFSFREDYSEEWKILSACNIRTITPYEFILMRTPEVLYNKRYAKKVISHQPKPTIGRQNEL